MKKITITLFIAGYWFTPLSILSQSKFQINSIGIDNQYYYHRIHEMKKSSFEDKNREIINQNEKLGKQTTFSPDKSIIKTGVDVTVSIKKRNKVKNPKIFQEFSFGLGYREVVKNAIQFYEEKPNGSFSPSNIWLLILFGNSTASTKTTSYEVNTRIISFQAQEMFWLINDKLFNIGIGLRADFGFELNSKLIQKDYAGGSSSSIWGANSYSNLVATTEYNSKNMMLFSGSIPVRLTMRLSKNKEKWSNKIKLATSALFGFQENFVNNDNHSSFFSIGFGVRYEL